MGHSPGKPQHPARGQGSPVVAYLVVEFAFDHDDHFVLGLV